MRVIVNADDFGKDHNTNKAIDACFKNNIISSATLLVNMEGFDEAVRIAKDNVWSENIGLHFNLVEGKALTLNIRNCRRLCDQDGNFIYKRNSVFFWNKRERKAIKEECTAQLLKMRVAGLKISHFDSHQHIHTEIGIFWTIRRVLKENKVNKVRISLNYNRKTGNIKRLYKVLFNYILKISGFRTTNIFCSFFDDFDSDHELLNKPLVTIEAMIHPDWQDDTLWDATMHEAIVPKKIKMFNYNLL